MENSNDEHFFRRQLLGEARKRLYQLPLGNPVRQKFSFLEIPGKPHLLYEIRDYSIDKELGKQLARSDFPFLFRAFEVGQQPPPRPGSKKAAEPSRVATIHEYLNWTVTADAASADDGADFDGFRIVALLPRFRPGWPPPGSYEKEEPKRHPMLGAPLPPLPQLLMAAKPISVATIRSGIGYLEVPFVATQDGKRNKGYGRALVEAIEQIARALDIPKLLLCSTDDQDVINTWIRLGFVRTSEEDLKSFDVRHGELLHMDNTVQMHKLVPAEKQWNCLKIKHGAWVNRVYYPKQLMPAPSGSVSIDGGRSKKKARVKSRKSSESGGVISEGTQQQAPVFEPAPVLGPPDMVW